MAFLDFIKNRQAAQQESTPQAAQEPNVEAPRIDGLSSATKSQAVEAARPTADLMQKATQHRTEVPDAQSDRDGGREALRHNQSSPDKTQEAMSPTDSSKGHTHQHGRGGWER